MQRISTNQKVKCEKCFGKMDKIYQQDLHKKENTNAQLHLTMKFLTYQISKNQRLKMSYVSTYGNMYPFW